MGPIYGLTLDDISNIDQAVTMEAGLPVHPTTRVYFDVQEPASYYASAVEKLDSVSTVMGELLDSFDETSISTGAEQSRVESYLATLGSSVAIWEIGNEVNGNWTGPYATVEAKLAEAYDDVSADGYETSLTLYANEYGPDNCGDGTSELTPVQYSEDYIPASIRDGLDYVFESYYPTQCGDVYPTDQQVATEMEALHGLFPNSELGFGELGLPNPVNPSTLSTAEQVMAWGYGLSPGLRYYVGGYFWWYGAEDLVPSTEPLYATFVSALEAERSALG